MNMNLPLGEAIVTGSVTNDGECAVKKGRHRRYEEARALKRGPDLDIEDLFTDLREQGSAGGPTPVHSDESLDDPSDSIDVEEEEDDYARYAEGD